MLGIIRLWLTCGFSDLLCAALQIQFDTTSPVSATYDACTQDSFAWVYTSIFWCGGSPGFSREREACSAVSARDDSGVEEACNADADCKGYGLLCTVERGTESCVYRTFNSGSKTEPKCQVLQQDFGGSFTAGSEYCGASGLMCKQISTPAPPCDTGAGTCRLIEDPHISVFDGGQISLLNAEPSMSVGRNAGSDGIGDKWLVKSASVSIQARYEADEKLAENNLFVRAVAIGGRFLEGSVITVGSLEDHITWNGKPILKHDFGNFSSFELNDEGMVVKITHSEHALNAANPSEESPGIELELPTGVSLIVNRLHHHINLAITMSPQEAGQEGLCGNFNGVALDDSWELSSQRLDPSVSPEESLFTGVAFT